MLPAAISIEKEHSPFFQFSKEASITEGLEMKEKLNTMQKWKCVLPHIRERRVKYQGHGIAGNPALTDRQLLREGSGRYHSFLFPVGCNMLSNFNVKLTQLNDCI